MQKFTENPYYIIMNPLSKEAQDKGKLPYYLYELNNQTLTDFVRLEYTLATSDSERIAVDHVVKALDPTAKSSVLSQNLQSSLNALKLLRQRVKFLIDIAKNSEEVRKDQGFMRKLNQICAQLPITSRETYEKYAFGEYSDIATVNMLASITKGFELLNELFTDYKISHGKEFGDE